MKKVRIMSLFLAMTMLLSACGGGKTSETTSSGTNRNAVFKEITDAYEVDGDVSQIIAVGDVVYVEQYHYTNDLPQAKMDVTAYTEIMVDETASMTEDVIIDEETYPEMMTTRVITGYAMDGTIVSQLEQTMGINSGC